MVTTLALTSTSTATRSIARPPIPGTSISRYELHVIAGPDAGRIVPLHAGSWRIGRGRHNTLVLPDKAVSNEHAELILTHKTPDAPDQLRSVLVHRGGRNGTQVLAPTDTTWRNLNRTGPTPCTQVLTPDTAVRMGQTVLVIRDTQDDPPWGTPVTTTRDSDGRLVLQPGPRIISEDPRTDIEVPSPPELELPTPLSWPMLLTPILAALAMVALTQQALLLVLTLTGPIAAGIQYLWDRRIRTRTMRERNRHYRRDCAAATDRVTAAVVTYRTQQRHQDGDLATILHIARDRTSQLWAGKGTDELWVRVGTRTDATSSSIVLTRGNQQQPLQLDHRPMLINLASHRLLGICGPAIGRERLAAAIIGQLATRHPPTHVRIECVPAGASSPPSHALDWVTQLPHAAPGYTPLGDPNTWTIRVCESHRGAPNEPAVSTDANADVRIMTLVLARSADQLPPDCQGFLQLGAPSAYDDPNDLCAAATVICQGHPARAFIADLPNSHWSTELTAALAPLRCGEPPRAATLPFADLYPTTLDAICAAWDASDSGLTVTLGCYQRQHQGHPWVLDLEHDGPHAVVAGSTGSGKSELLRSWITALASTYPPEKVSFILVDYKGGTAFDQLHDLPHVAGLVSDLEPEHTRRVLASLTAEIRRRERLLRTPDNRSTLARLVLVIDEFRVLAEEHPEVLQALIRIATVGRGLGIHLIVATQRPQGIISPEIRANAALRICLRVHDASESIDVIDSPEAASALAAGHGFARSTTHGLRAIQASYLPQASEIVAAVAQAARTARRTAPAPPWLPPLPPSTGPRDIQQLPTVNLRGMPVPDTEFCIRWGMIDLPHDQAQAALVWCPTTDGNVAIAGSPRSGRSTAIRTLVAMAATAAPAMPATTEPTDYEVHVIDAAGALRDLADRPMVGTVTPVSDDRSLQLLRHLEQLVADRHQAPSQPWPLILLAIDDWESVQESWQAIHHGQPVNDLIRLARDGAGVGFRLVVTGGRGVITGPVSTIVGSRLIAPNSDDLLLIAAGLRATQEHRAGPTGRVLLADGIASELAQAQLLHGDHVDQFLGTDAAKAHCNDPSSGPILRLEPLPRHVPYEPGTSLWAVAAPQGTPLELPTEPWLLVTGPPRSGRSTTARTLAHAAASTRSVLLISMTSADSLAPIPKQLRLMSPEQFDPYLRAEPDTLVIADDGWWQHSELSAWLASQLGQPEQAGGLRIVVCATSTHTTMALSGPLATVRDRGCAIVLGQRTHSSAIHPDAGLSMPLPPGRGVWVTAQRHHAIQVLCS